MVMETTATTMPEWERGLMISREEFNKEMRESRKEFDRRMRESDERFNERMEKSNEEINKLKKERDEEINKLKKERDEEYDKRKKERDEEYDKQKKERDEELNKRFKESSAKLDKIFGKWGNRYGEILEALASPGLQKKFRSFGFDFSQLARNIEIVAEGQFVGEIDMRLENNDSVMIVEMKSKPCINDIKDLIEKMDQLRAYMDGKGDKRKYYGAMGGLVFPDNEKKFALKTGFYIVEPSGETFDIVAPENEYKPRVW